MTFPASEISCPTPASASISIYLEGREQHESFVPLRSTGHLKREKEMCVPNKRMGQKWIVVFYTSLTGGCLVETRLLWLKILKPNYC